MASPQTPARLSVPPLFVQGEVTHHISIRSITMSSRLCQVLHSFFVRVVWKERNKDASMKETFSGLQGRLWVEIQKKNLTICHKKNQTSHTMKPFSEVKLKALLFSLSDPSVMIVRVICSWVCLGRGADLPWSNAVFTWLIRHLLDTAGNTIQARNTSYSPAPQKPEDSPRQARRLKPPSPASFKVNSYDSVWLPEPWYQLSVKCSTILLQYSNTLAICLYQKTN